jgi:hypothetical protein
MMYDEIRFAHDRAYRDGFLDCASHMIEQEELEKARRAKTGLARYDAMVKRRQIGWRSDNGGIYFWFVGWDCWSLGFHVCVSAPNVEIHLPFGFIRIGLDSGRHHLKELRKDAAQ